MIFPMAKIALGARSPIIDYEIEKARECNREFRLTAVVHATTGLRKKDLALWETPGEGGKSKRNFFV